MSDKPSLVARAGALGQIILAIAGLFIASAVLGALVTPHLPADLRTPVLALAMWGGVLAGALMLRFSKSSYRTIGLTPPGNWSKCLLWAAAAVAVGEAGAVLIGDLIHKTTDWQPLDTAYIRDSIHGNLTAYLVWIALVVWGSAAFGEELLARGFIMDRLQAAFGRGGLGIALAVIGQAAIFGALHAIQGPTGVVITAYAGLVFAGVYFASGRNLWAPILAHGIVDSISLTLMYLGIPLPGFVN